VNKFTRAYCLGWLDLAQQKEKESVGRVWASDPASPVHIWLRVCLAKNTLMRFSRVLFPFYFDLWTSKPLFDIRKFQKYVGIIVDLFVGTSRFVFFFV
jgi:hypothetical protein